jgi:hypothetical protein
LLVELDIFSGRPNPRWELDEIQGMELRQMQSLLEASNQTPAEPPALGYRGFWYSDAAGRIHAYRGTITTARAVLADPSLSIERYLLNQLPVEFAGLRGRVTLELVPPK